jgi:hypothetical protein
VHSLCVVAPKDDDAEGLGGVSARRRSTRRLGLTPADCEPTSSGRRPYVQPVWKGSPWSFGSNPAPRQMPMNVTVEVRCSLPTTEHEGLSGQPFERDLRLRKQNVLRAQERDDGLPSDRHVVSATLPHQPRIRACPHRGNGDGGTARRERAHRLRLHQAPLQRVTVFSALGARPSFACPRNNC